MTKSEFEDLLLRYSKGDCTKEENLKIRKWFKRIKLKPHFTLTTKEKFLLETKMLVEIDTKIKVNKRRLLERNLFTGFFNTYFIYGCIAASMITAGFLNKNKKTVGNLARNEKPSLKEKPVEMTFVYNEAPLSTIVYDLGRSYGMQIILSSEKMKSCSFTGDLSNMPLMQKFDTVCESVGANYQVQGSNIILTGQGCR